MKSFNLIFIQTILESNKLESNEKVINSIDSYVNESFFKMPDFMRNGVYLLSFFFNHLYLLFYFKRFEDLEIIKRQKAIYYIKSKNIILLSLLIKLYENLVLNKYLEND